MMSNQQMWCMYFAGIVAFQMHPRNDKPIDLEKCAKITDDMVRLTIHKFKENPPWAGLERR